MMLTMSLIITSNCYPSPFKLVATKNFYVSVQGFISLGIHLVDIEFSAIDAPRFLSYAIDHTAIGFSLYRHSLEYILHYQFHRHSSSIKTQIRIFYKSDSSYLNAQFSIHYEFDWGMLRYITSTDSLHLASSVHALNGQPPHRRLQLHPLMCSNSTIYATSQLTTIPLSHPHLLDIHLLPHFHCEILILLMSPSIHELASPDVTPPPRRNLPTKSPSPLLVKYPE